MIAADCRRTAPEAAARTAAFAFLLRSVLFALLLAPIVAHGCHGDDVDHEPGSHPQTERVDQRK